MTELFRPSGFTADDRVHVADDAALPAGPFFVSKARLLAERDALRTRGDDLGLALEPGDRLDDIADDLGSIAAIAIRFPVFNDGRGCSLARRLRQRHGFGGELRAFGDILFDQVEALFRVGFDAQEIVHEPTGARLAAAGAPGFLVHYQGPATPGFRSLLRRPWASRSTENL